MMTIISIYDWQLALVIGAAFLAGGITGHWL